MIEKRLLDICPKKSVKPISPSDKVMFLLLIARDTSLDFIRSTHADQIVTAVGIIGNREIDQVTHIKIGRPVNLIIEHIAALAY